MPEGSPGAAQGSRRASPPPCLRIPREVRPLRAPEAARPAVERARGWALSLALHGALLLILGAWSVSSRQVPGERATELDTRLLAGSEMGVEDGLTADGGLNTAVELMAAPAPAPEPSLPAPTSLDITASGLGIVPPAGAALPSAGGGVENPNPGAGNGKGSGMGRLGAGGEEINGVAVRRGDPQFTLLWDSEADLDLHVIEPGGVEIDWEHPDGALGGTLDVDNCRGFGPENIYWGRKTDDAGQEVAGKLVQLRNAYGPA